MTAVVLQRMLVRFMLHACKPHHAMLISSTPSAGSGVSIFSTRNAMPLICQPYIGMLYRSAMAYSSLASHLIQTYLP
jgi:hypothetical protein